MSKTPLRLFIVTGEESGDQLGASMMKALKKRCKGDLIVMGVGGKAMAEEGLISLFNMDEIAVMGITAVAARLPTILKRINETSKAIIEAQPDALIIIDSPDFTHRVAHKVRAEMPNLPVVNYVCPSVWAWRPGRARKMKAYVDHVLAILPFEPQALKDLDGPPATYIGHPLAHTMSDKVAKLTANDHRTLLLLPGSRKGEIKRHLPILEQTIEKLSALREDVSFIMPVVPHLKDDIKNSIENWAYPVELVSSAEQKKQAFNKATAALAASGTVCLELALSNIPMIAIYRLDPVAKLAPYVVKTWSANLPNLIVDYPAVPEMYDPFIKPYTISRALNRLLDKTPERQVQLDAFKTLREKMALDEGVTADKKAADVVMKLLSDANS